MIIMLALFLILFIDGLGISLVLPLFPNLFLDPETSILSFNTSNLIRDYIYAFSLVSFSFGMFLGSPILGELSDKFGRKKILLLSLYGTCIGYIISGSAILIKSPGLFILGRIIDGLTAGSIPIAQAAINDITPDDKKAGNVGLVLFAVTAGYFLGPLLADYLAKIRTYFPFFITALLSLFSIFLLSFLKEQFQCKINNNINWLKAFNIFNLISKVANSKIIILCFLLFQLGWSMYFQYMPHFLTTLKLNNYISVTLSIIGIGMACSFCFLTRTLQQKLTALNGSIIASLLIAIFIAVQIFETNNVVLFICSSFIAAICYAFGYSFLIAFLSQKIEQDLQGLIMGVAASMSALSSAITAVLGANIAWINFSWTFWFAVICFSFCFFILYGNYINHAKVRQ